MGVHTVLLALLALALGMGCRAPADPSPATAEWQVVRYRSRHGNTLRVALTNGRRLDLKLDHLAVFDCRSDCFRDMRYRLPQVTDSDTLCLWSFYWAGEWQISKLWVNRYRCEPGGRVIPP